MEFSGAMRREPHPTDPELSVHVPEGDEPTPELSIVIPAMNESLTIEEFVSWCHEGIASAGVRAEILIVDSSSDDTASKAVAAGARVLTTPPRGLGRAYIDAIPVIRGDWVIMGDADCTYDFRRLAPFVERFRAGDEYVMGSRWKGSIEKGSMPPHHQYFGTPVTTWILNRIYGSAFSDIHCGMRGVTREALQRIDLSSQSWEYASEMVLKSVHHQLRTSEVPVTFLRDREGRLSHHKREGWFSPFRAAWINLRAMFVYGADFFLVKPGFLMLCLGLLLTLPLAFGPLTVGPVTFSLFWMLLGLTLSVVGLQCVYLGLLAQVPFDFGGGRAQRLLERFRYNRAALLSGLSVLAGICLCMPFGIRYISDGLSFTGLVAPLGHLAILGLLLATIGFQTFTFTLVVHAFLTERR